MSGEQRLSLAELLEVLGGDESFLDEAREAGLLHEDDGYDEVFLPADTGERVEEGNLEWIENAITDDDLNVEIERDVLTISGKRERKDEKDLHGVHLERSVNARFARRFALGKELEADKIEGKLQDGFLRLTVPKKEKALPRRIHVG